MKVYLDTNVIVSFFDESDPNKNIVSELLGDTSIVAYTGIITLLEFERTCRQGEDTGGLAGDSSSMSKNIQVFLNSYGPSTRSRSHPP